MIEKANIGNRRYRPRLRPRHGWPEVTALIDIFFLALMFFVLSGNSAKVSAISVDLPRSSHSRIMQVEKNVISLVPNGSGAGYIIYFQEQPVDMLSLAGELQKMRSQRYRPAVIIRADRRISFDAVAEVMELAENSGIACLLATVPEERQDAKFEQ